MLMLLLAVSRTKFTGNEAANAEVAESSATAATALTRAFFMSILQCQNENKQGID
jgi:hypothetical protein